MKFEIKNTYCGYYLWEKSKDWLITFGDIHLYKENFKNLSSWNQNENKFDYHGISKILCGKLGYSSNNTFSPKRILIIQMK